VIGLVAAVFVASLLGSMHCVGMCGAFLAIAVDTNLGSPGKASRLPLAAWYHLGRLVTYVTLGVIGGAIGAAVNLTAEAAGLQRAAAALAGSLMIVFGVLAVLRHVGLAKGRVLRAAQAATGRVPLPKKIEAAALKGHRAAMGLPPMGRALTIGLLTTLLPCGWLYAFAITAAGTGSPVSGAIVMVVFWAGTLPIMIGLGLVVQRAGGVLRRYIPLATSLMVVAFGIITLLGREMLPAFASPAPVAFGDAAQAAAHARTLRETPLECCDPGDAPQREGGQGE
jgi:sulfite exporter TauE/SafE